MERNNFEGDVQKQRRRLLMDFLKRVVESPMETHDHKAVFTCEEADVETVPLFPSNEKMTQYFLKNLFLQEKKKKEKYLIVANEKTQCRMNKVAKGLPSAKVLRFAPLEEMSKILMIGRGSCTGFALFPTAFHDGEVSDICIDLEDGVKLELYKKEEIEVMKDIRLLIDHTLLEEDREKEIRVVLHPLMNSASTSITNTDFLKFVLICKLKEKIVFDFAENKIVKTL